MRFLLPFVAVAGVACVAAQSNVTCQSGVHIIVARASLEPVGFGTLLGPVKDMILAQIPNSDAIAVPYPATIAGNPPYPTSEEEGVGNMTQLVKQYGDACPNNKMVLMGYSQGAQVLSDTLIGASYVKTPIFENTTGIDQTYIDKIVAVVMMGDPANVAGQPFLHGNSTRNGTFPRNNTADWVSTGLVNKMISYCDANDTFCDSGSSIAVHVGYIGEYGKEAAAFVVNKTLASNTSSSSSPSSSSTPSSSSNGASISPTGSPTSNAVTPSSTGGAGASIVIPGKLLYVLTGLLQCALFFAVTF